MEIVNGYIDVVETYVKRIPYAVVKITMGGTGAQITARISRLVEVFKKPDILEYKNIPCRVELEANVVRNIGNFIEDRWVYTAEDDDDVKKEQLIEYGKELGIKKINFRPEIGVLQFFMY